MRVLILGVGDAFTKIHFGSSALVAGPDGYLLIDCPDLVHRAIHEANRRAGWDVDASKIHDVLITHLHGDHCNGLESFGFARMLRRMKTPSAPLPRLHISRPASERVWERLAPAMDGACCLRHSPARLADFYLLDTIEPQSEAVIAGLTVRCRFTQHPVPTTGLLISDGEWTLGWSSDTPYEQAHIDWLDQADLIVHESSRGPIHTPIEALNSLPDELRAKLRLIHLRDDFDRSGTDIEILSQGDVLQGPVRESDGRESRPQSASDDRWAGDRSDADTAAGGTS